MIQKNEVPSFEGLGIADNILAVLKENKFTSPTPIQHQVIPVANTGKDVVGIAQTGTGKTLAFGVPLIQCVLATRKTGLVLLPTRELALQVNEVLEKLGKPLGVKTAVLIGGASMWKQKIRLQSKPDIIIATPGRLADHLKQKTYSLNRIKVAVLDEADRMLDIGFLPEINRILGVCPKDRQTMLFSATMPSEIAKVAANHMQLPLRIEVAPQGTTAEKIEQEVFFIGRDQKMRLLDKILSDYPGSILIFSRTKHGAKKIVRSITAMGHKAVEIHSNRSLAQRIVAMEGFKSGRFRVMVATDIASRGIDVSNISLVINYDLPDCLEDYVHRIGRTGRAGKTGKAISFATPDQKHDIKQIERLIRKTLPILALPVLPPARAEQAMFEDRGPRQGGFGGRSNSGRRDGNRGGFSRGGGENRGRFNRDSGSRGGWGGERRVRESGNFRGEVSQSASPARTSTARTSTSHATSSHSAPSRSNESYQAKETGFSRNKSFDRKRPSTGGYPRKPFGASQNRSTGSRDAGPDKNLFQDDYSRWKKSYNDVSSHEQYPDKKKFAGKKFGGNKSRPSRGGSNSRPVAFHRKSS